MPRQEGETAAIIRNYMKRYPRLSKHKLAHRIYTDNKALFTSKENVRSAIRRYTGNNGVQNRKNVMDGELLKRTETNPYSLPPAIREFDSSTYYVNQSSRCMGVLADTHVPFHEKSAITAAIKYLKKREPDTILLNGDIVDFYTLSYFSKTPTLKGIRREIKSTHQLFAVLREEFPKAQIIYKVGNHDVRLNTYIWRKSEELWDMPELKLDNVFKLLDHGIIYITEMRPVKYGNLMIVHGEDWGSGTTSPVNPARTAYLRAQTNVMVAHWHQVSEHCEHNLKEEIISAWSIGCLCGLHPRYRPRNKWSHGFAVVEREAGGSFHVDNKKIWQGKVL